MNKAKRIMACVLAVMLLAVTLSGCTTFDNFRKAFLNKNPDNDAEIRIGIFEPTSGADKEYGEAEVKGIELANKLYPEVNGAQVELIYADNKSDIDVAETAIVDLLKKNPVAVLGSYGNIYSLVAGEYLETAQVPGISISNTNPLITKNNPYYFRVSTVETYQAVAMARYLYEELGQKKAAILIPENNEHAVAMATEFKDKMEAQTGKENSIAAYEKYTAGEDNFTEQLQTIAASKADYVYLCGDYEDITNILKQTQNLNLTNLTFLGDSTWAEEGFMDTAAKYVNGNIAFTTLYTETELVTDRSEEFLNAYKEEYDEEPSASAALAFDAYVLLIEAIERAGVGCTSQELTDSLAATKDFQGASGVITFNSIGDPKKSVVINTLNNKTITPLCTIEPAETKSKTDDNEKENSDGTED